MIDKSLLEGRHRAVIEAKDAAVRAKIAEGEVP